MVTTQSTRDIYFIMDIKKNTLVAGQEITVGNRLEFFSDKAYDKGDANHDEKVDILDLIRTKKMLANGSSEFVSADIDSNGRLEAADLGFVRKWLLCNDWF